MTDKDQQLEQFRAAVDRKAEAAAEAAQQPPAHERPADEADQSQDAGSPRQKSSQHGKVTADNWNQ